MRLGQPRLDLLIAFGDDQYFIDKTTFCSFAQLMFETMLGQNSETHKSKLAKNSKSREIAKVE